MQLLEVCILNFSLLTTRPLSSEEASLSCGEAGEVGKESTRGIPIVPCVLSIFSIIAIFIGIPSGSLCGGESYQASTGDEAKLLFTQQHCIMTISFFGKIENVFS